MIVKDEIFKSFVLRIIRLIFKMYTKDMCSRWKTCIKNWINTKTKIKNKTQKVTNVHFLRGFKNGWWRNLFSIQKFSDKQCTILYYFYPSSLNGVCNTKSQFILLWIRTLTVKGGGGGGGQNSKMGRFA